MVGVCAELIFVNITAIFKPQPSRPPLASRSTCRHTSPPFPRLAVLGHAAANVCIQYARTSAA